MNDITKIFEGEHKILKDKKIERPFTLKPRLHTPLDLSVTHESLNLWVIFKICTKAITYYVLSLLRFNK